MGLLIEDYALIGDCESAALVGVDGSIDWLCLPRFDAGACFAALLGNADHGHWRIAPRGATRCTRRRYRDDTLILETTFETADGAVTLIDFMPLRDGVPDLVRIVRGDRGRVAMEVELVIRLDYGHIVPWVRKVDGGIRATGGPDTLYCTGDIPLTGRDLKTVGEFEISAGETRSLVLAWQPTHRADQPGPLDVPASLRETEAFWRKWTARCTYDGPWRDAVVRSLITLKALTYAPTGGVVAAPTTSLPEHIGGQRNWDYRYCWLRDATFTLHALARCGYQDEAIAWRTWLVNAVAGSPRKLQIMYGIAGERRLPEMELDWLPGYEESAPVRIGNDAHRQRQLDVYGEVMDALHLARCAGIPLDDNAWHIQLAIMEVLEDEWRRPDEGIWEMRGGQRHFTHSKVMAWVAFDRAVKAVERLGLEGPGDRWREIRDEIRAQILQEGYDPALESFVQYYGATVPDASLLMLPLVGFLPADDPRMLGTVANIQRRLSRDGLILRYEPDPEVDGLPRGEGAFLLCSFWLADNLALQGCKAEAREHFERLLALCNDVGLLAEEYDPRQGRMLGNFPQAFSHVGLINTALILSEQGPEKLREGTGE